MHHLGLPNGESFDLDYIKERIGHQDDERLFFIGEAIRRGTTLEEIHKMTKIDYFFLNKFQNIINIEHELKEHQGDLEYLKYAKDYGFSDKVIAHRWDMNEDDVYQLRVKMILNLYIKWLIHVQQNLNRQRLIIMERMNLKMNLL